MSDALADTVSAPAGFAADLRAAADSIWEAQHRHPFVRGIADGSLDEDVFRHYVRQDYLFLIEYGRFFGIACARAPRFEDAAAHARLANAVFDVEMNLHREFAREWGVSDAELEAERPSPTTRAYTDFLLRTATLGETPEIVGALLPCMWGYREVAERIAADGTPRDGRYARWLGEYTGDEFGELVEWCRTLADRVAAPLGVDARASMREAFLVSSRHELAFWDACWRRES